VAPLLTPGSGCCVTFCVMQPFAKPCCRTSAQMSAQQQHRPGLCWRSWQSHWQKSWQQCHPAGSRQRSLVFIVLSLLLAVDCTCSRVLSSHCCCVFASEQMLNCCTAAVQGWLHAGVAVHVVTGRRSAAKLLGICSGTDRVACPGCLCMTAAPQLYVHVHGSTVWMADSICRFPALLLRQLVAV
jgi:hypothetical protein